MPYHIGYRLLGTRYWAGLLVRLLIWYDILNRCA